VLQAYYRERGFLDATIQAPQPQFDAATRKATIRIPVKEGNRYQVGSVQFVGNTAIKPQLLIEKSELKADQPYELPLRQVSIDQIRDLYLAAGYHDAQVETTVARGKDKVDITYRITEGPKEVVEKIEVAGNDATSEALVRSQVALKAGDALEPAKLAESRRNLYSTGAYSLIDLERVPAGDVSAAGIQPMLLRAKVREVQPFSIKYGAYFDTDRGPGAVIDFANRNSLGSARAIGGRLRYDSDFREGRVFFSQPLLRRFPVQSIVSGYVNRSLLPTFITDRVGVSAQQEIRFKKLYLVNYGYRMERVHTFEKVPDDFLPFDVTLRVAPLTFTLNRESRNDVLDATKGSFISQAFEWAPESLGSDVRFIRYYAQYFKYIALAKPVEIPMSGGLKKPRLVYAGAARLGLARGLGGQELTLSERFFAGGGTTLRGFAQNTLGPKDFLDEPAGGNAVILINNEIRFPLASIFDGVGFVDIGNVYNHVSDISFRDFRKVAGAGLRIRTPYFMIRLDYGFKLDRRPGESIGGFFFSIGQAF
jgi:outer membrane protein assembly complex protein YaeT